MHHNDFFYTDYTVEVLLTVHNNPGVRTMDLWRKLNSKWSTTKLSGELRYLLRNNRMHRQGYGHFIADKGNQLLADERHRQRSIWKRFCVSQPVHPRDGAVL